MEMSLLSQGDFVLNLIHCHSILKALRLEGCDDYSINCEEGLECPCELERSAQLEFLLWSFREVSHL